MDLWDVAAHMEKLRKSSRSLYDDTNMHNPLRMIACDAPLVSMSAANGLIIAGDTGGNVSVLDPSEKAAPGGPLQKFSDHKGSVMDIYAVSSVNTLILTNDCFMFLKSHSLFLCIKKHNGAYEC